jgi:hypothetical protein
MLAALTVIYWETKIGERGRKWESNLGTFLAGGGKCYNRNQITEIDS